MNEPDGEYSPFKGICLTDTFQLYEKEDMIQKLLADNSQRRIRQKELKDIKVIIGNPPYSAGQKSENDNAKNIEYLHLDETIRQTYAKHSKVTNKQNLYDSYIRAIRWGSDRIGESGVMAYVSGGAWIERGFADGLRKSLAEEYTNIHVLNLRGDIRKNMLSKGRAKEGGNIFESGSMTGIAITLFVKNPDATEHGKIYYHDIGDDLGGKEKLKIIQNFKSIDGITTKKGWQDIVPDQYNDWINQRDESFDTFIDMGDKKNKNSITIFENYSLGLNTGRDAWCFNFSKLELGEKIQSTISFYNEEVERYSLHRDENVSVDNFVDNDATKIKWAANLKKYLELKKRLNYNDKNLLMCMYRPFTRQWTYFSRDLNERVYQIPQIFPHDKSENRVILVSGIGARTGFCVLITDSLPNLHTIDTGQCFPLKLYEKTDEAEDGLFANQPSENGYRVKDGISDVGLAHFMAAYPNEIIGKEDLFYYIYGLLHSEDYRARYADNLSKQLPRIPCVKTAVDFWAFSNAGRALAELHVNYETVDPYPVTYKEGALFMDDLKSEDYRVEKMKFAGKAKNKDKTTVIYNPKITMTDIPLAAYDYVVNGKPALEWVMERQCIKTDKKSGIVNDANLYATETVGDAAYPLKLFQRVITVSLETMKIVNALPKLDIQEDKKEKAA